MARRLAGAGSGELSGETDLGALIRSMAPRLFEQPYDFAVLSGEESADAFALIREDEGTTAIIASPAGEWARISLTVHSSLDAVGLTAAITTTLTAEGISANVVAGAHHDHLFVQWHRRHDAMRVLAQLSEEAR